MCAFLRESAQFKETNYPPYINFSDDFCCVFVVILWCWESDGRGLQNGYPLVHTISIGRDAWSLFFMLEFIGHYWTFLCVTFCSVSTTFLWLHFCAISAFWDGRFLCHVSAAFLCVTFCVTFSLFCSFSAFLEFSGFYKVTSRAVSCH